MEEINKINQDLKPTEEEQSSFSIRDVIKMVVLNWKWFALSVITCVAVCVVYLKYTTPIYQMGAKFLIKEEGPKSRRSGIMQAEALGMMVNSYGLENEIEILNSNILARQIVEDLKLYVSYSTVGNFKNNVIYKTQPISVDMDKQHLNQLNSPVQLSIKRENGKFHIKGNYRIPVDGVNSKGPYEIDETIDKLPAQLGTGAGIIYLTKNKDYILKEGNELLVTMFSPQQASYIYQGRFSASQRSKMSSVANLTYTDAIPARGTDYLNQLAICYNELANEDKNEIASRTDQFINSRLEKINRELGDTESTIENFKKQNKVVELGINAQTTLGNTNLYEQKINEAQIQLELIRTLQVFVNNDDNRYKTFPANIGIDDAASKSFISDYNKEVLNRNRLLASASENSPSVTPITRVLDHLYESIKKSLNQAFQDQNLKISSLQQQYHMYSGRVQQTPEQERILTQIGRQQEVKAGLFLMLLQKREENSISLASTVDKGKIIEAPQFKGKVSPRSPLLMLIAFILGIVIPFTILIIRELLRYKIEGREDVAKLTNIPIIADIAVASNEVKESGEILVHENSNNSMEEIFRYLRTNLQFMLKENQKVILFTSAIPGEGKTFNAANTAASFALLDKKVLLVGLDVRKPRLGPLFNIKDTKNGITNLLIKNDPTEQEIEEVIKPSGIIKNLDIILAGPTPPNPAELIAGKSFDKIFKVLREKYDYIILDSAPIGMVTDTFMIAHAADATVIVCRADFTDKASFVAINEACNSKKLPNASIVINGIDMSKKKYGYSYGIGKYGKYSRYGYGKYGKYSYGSYSRSSYGSYSKNHYSRHDDNSIKK